MSIGKFHCRKIIWRRNRLIGRGNIMTRVSKNAGILKKHAGLEKTHKLETDDAAQVLQSLQKDKRDINETLEHKRIEKENDFDSYQKTEEAAKMAEDVDIDKEHLKETIQNKLENIRNLRC